MVVVVVVVTVAAFGVGSVVSAVKVVWERWAEGLWCDGCGGGGRSVWRGALDAVGESSLGEVFGGRKRDDCAVSAECGHVSGGP